MFPALEKAVFPAVETSVAEARRWLRKVVDGHPRLDDAVLLLSESFTNAVLHTRSAAVGVVVLVEEGQRLQIEVIDEGAETSPCVCGHTSQDDLGESGRGIRLLRALSDQWGFVEEHPRCVVWFTLVPEGPSQPGTAR
ncbi:ATP-binding protein [Sphaerisporangium flaviroseum]|uniref:ATP-binding protein n=1 Tax=Sphaerisporangium flaviroseum TaxID=509199 RepID=UPI0031ED1CBF